MRVPAFFGAWVFYCRAKTRHAERAAQRDDS
jgi:hypothetical protein